MPRLWTVRVSSPRLPSSPHLSASPNFVSSPAPSLAWAEDADILARLTLCPRSQGNSTSLGFAGSFGVSAPRPGHVLSPEIATRTIFVAGQSVQ